MRFGYEQASGARYDRQSRAWIFPEIRPNPMWWLYIPLGLVIALVEFLPWLVWCVLHRAPLEAYRGWRGKD